ncbi:MAG: glycosyltransferase family 2 protein [Chitinivibrionales bacterium]|nr:glycosyltransferase family 2 protein [Chitinivibrionales bacterium]
MMMIVKIVFFLSLFLLIYAYSIYPVLLRTLQRVRKRKLVRKEGYKPTVSILVPVYNEEKIIGAKIENCLALDYPKEKLQIMICSDCSSDGTSHIVSTYNDSRLRFIDYRTRSGKTGVINKALPQATGEIVVLTDANTMLNADALVRMVSLYGNKKIGAVLGQVILVEPKGSYGLAKELAYRTFESKLKYYEGVFGASMGAFGGFYSIRKELFTPLPANAYSNDDLLIPLTILKKGHAVVFDNLAYSYEDTAFSVADEFKRRVRIGAGNFQAFFLLLSLLNPFRGVVCWMYLSHKVLRWFSPFLLLSLFLSNLFLADTVLFELICFGQYLFYSLAAGGYLVYRFKLTIPFILPAYHFVSMNIALLLGFFKYVKGIKSATWDSTERLPV